MSYNSSFNNPYNYPVEVNMMNNPQDISSATEMMLKRINRVGVNPSEVWLNEGAAPQPVTVTYLNYYFDSLLPSEVLKEFKQTGWVFESRKMYAIAPNMLVEIKSHGLADDHFIVSAISLSNIKEEKLQEQYFTKSIHTALLMGLSLLSSKGRI